LRWAYAVHKGRSMKNRNRKPLTPFPSHDQRTAKAVGAQPDKSELLEMLKRIEAQLNAPEPESKKVRLPPAPPEKVLPEDEIQTMLKMAEASLRTYGTMVPPREVFYVTGSKTCPHCDPKGKNPRPIVTDFGLKKGPKGEMKPHSWCLRCRSSPDAHPTRAKYGRQKRR
jgi:hypothetical protein